MRATSHPGSMPLPLVAALILAVVLCAALLARPAAAQVLDAATCDTLREADLIDAEGYPAAEAPDMASGINGMVDDGTLPIGPAAIDPLIALIAANGCAAPDDGNARDEEASTGEVTLGMTDGTADGTADGLSDGVTGAETGGTAQEDRPNPPSMRDGTPEAARTSAVPPPDDDVAYRGLGLPAWSLAAGGVLLGGALIALARRNQA